MKFALNGFGLSGATNPPIYVHYVQPSGGSVKTYKLGTAGGACGKLTSTKRRLFPFAARRGNWKLQFDTSKKYVKGVKTSTFLFYTLGVHEPASTSPQRRITRLGDRSARDDRGQRRSELHCDRGQQRASPHCQPLRLIVTPSV